jgi:hypothetical protein
MRGPFVRTPLNGHPGPPSDRILVWWARLGQLCVKPFSQSTIV